MVHVKSGQYIDFNVNSPMFANGGIPGLVKKTRVAVIKQIFFRNTNAPFS